MTCRIDLPFCLFLILVIFLSLAPPKDANGIRAGEAVAVRVVMLKCWLKGGLFWFCGRLQECGKEMLDNCRPRRGSTLVEDYRVGKVMSMERISKYAVADVEDCKGRRRAGKVDGCLKKKGRREGRRGCSGL